jgi:hypothetical protein
MHTTILATAAILEGIPVGRVDPRPSSLTTFSLYFYNHHPNHILHNFWYRTEN